MSIEKMFVGLDKQEWNKAIKSQNTHLKKENGHSIATDVIDADS